MKNRGAAFKSWTLNVISIITIIMFFQNCSTKEFTEYSPSQSVINSELTNSSSPTSLQQNNSLRPITASAVVSPNNANSSENCEPTSPTCKQKSPEEAVESSSPNRIPEVISEQSSPSKSDLVESNQETKKTSSPEATNRPSSLSLLNVPLAKEPSLSDILSLCRAIYYSEASTSAIPNSLPPVSSGGRIKFVFSTSYTMSDITRGRNLTSDPVGIVMSAEAHICDTSSSVDKISNGFIHINRVHGEGRSGGTGVSQDRGGVRIFNNDTIFLKAQPLVTNRVIFKMTYYSKATIVNSELVGEGTLKTLLLMPEDMWALYGVPK